MLPGGDDTQGESHRQAQQHRLDADEHGRTKTAEDDVGHRTAGVQERRAQVAPDEVAQVLDVLHRHRIIQSVFFQHDLLLLRRQHGEALGIKRRAGELLHQEEGDCDDNKERKHKIHQALANVF